MTDTPQTIEERLDDILYQFIDAYDKGPWGGLQARTKQQIKDLLTDTLRSIELPEKVPIHKTDPAYGELRSPINYREEGFNQAIDLAHQSIQKKIVEVSE